MAEYAMPIQVKMPRIRSHPRKDAVDVLTGTDYLGSISVGEFGALKGDLLATVEINPWEFDFTRLQQFAALYQRYRFTKAHVYYQGDAGSTDRGSVIGFMDYDVDNMLEVDEPVNVNKAIAQYAAEANKLWQTQRYELGQLDSYTDLYIHPVEGTEKRLVYQGVWYLVAATDIAPNTPLGTIFLDYEIEYSIPSLENVEKASNQTLNIKAAAVGTAPAQPLSSAVEEGTDPNFPPTNIDYEFVSSPGSTLILKNLRKGAYLVTSHWSGQITAGSGAQSLATTWEVVSPSSVLFSSGVSSSTESSFSQSAATGQTASLARTVFAKTIYVPAFTREVVLSVESSTPGTGFTFNTPMEVVISRLPNADGWPTGMLAKRERSRVYGGGRPRGVNLLNGLRVTPSTRKAHDTGEALLLRSGGASRPKDDCSAKIVCGSSEQPSDAAYSARTQTCDVSCKCCTENLGTKF